MQRPRRRGGRGARPFDAATKHLLESDPGAWLRYVGLPSTDPVSIVDADLSIVLAEADKVLHLGGPAPRLVHVELQASYDATLPTRMLQYNVLLHRRHRLPVASVVVLLRPEADGPAMSDRVELAWEGAMYLAFTYHTVRAWTLPVDAVLEGGLGTLPLAPLAAGAPDALPDVIRRIDDRLAAEATPGEAATLRAATFILLGLRYSGEVVEMIESMARAIEESTTYQAILREGMARGEARGQTVAARRILLRLGTRRFGPPGAETQAIIDALTESEYIEGLTERLLDATTWGELLAAR